MATSDLEIEGQGHKTIAFVVLPIYTHIPNLKVLTKIFFKLSRPKGNLCGGGGVTVLNPKYPRLSSGDTIKAFFLKGKVISTQFHKNGIRRMWDSFNVPKIGNLYHMNTDQLQYINNHITAC